MMSEIIKKEQREAERSKNHGIRLHLEKPLYSKY
jgi:hypothetical protein